MGQYLNKADLDDLWGKIKADMTHALAISGTDIVLTRQPHSGDPLTPSGNAVNCGTISAESLKTFLSLGTAAYKNISNSYSATSSNAMSGKAVAAALATLPTPMQFIGSLGTGGTYDASSLPAASSENNGWTLKVITDGTYQGVTAKVGDELISDGTNWILIPSGDEPSGTVTSVGMTVPTGLVVARENSGSYAPITSSGTFVITLQSGYMIPGGGTSGQLLKSNGSSAPSWASQDDIVAGTAKKLNNTSLIGNTNKPVYFTAQGVPAACDYELNKNVPSDAVFTDTATATDDILDGSNNGTAVKYAPYDSTTANSTWVGTAGNAGKLYLGTVNPSKTTRLNYNGYFYATKLYSGAVEVVTLSATQALENKTYNGYTLAAACAKGVDTSIGSSATNNNVPTSLAVKTLVDGYLPLTGGTIQSTTGNMPLEIMNGEDNTNGAYIKFADDSNEKGVLGVSSDSVPQFGVKTNDTYTYYNIPYVASAGTSGQVLTSNGSGASSWTAQSSLVAGKATVLETSRNIWGQSFNGSADITGDMSSVGDVKPSEDNGKILGDSANGRYWATAMANIVQAKTTLTLKLGNTAKATLSSTGLSVVNDIKSTTGNIAALAGGVAAYGIADLDMGAGGGGSGTITLIKIGSTPLADVDGVVTIPLAASGTDGAMLGTDKVRLDNLALDVSGLSTANESFSLTVRNSGAGSNTVVTVGRIGTAYINALN